MDFNRFEFDSSFLGYENCLFYILRYIELSDWILVLFTGRAQAGNLLFRDSPVNRTPYPVNRTSSEQDRTLGLVQSTGPAELVNRAEAESLQDLGFSLICCKTMF